MADQGEHDANTAVPKLPRSVGFKLSMPQLMRIGVTGAILVLVVMMREPCSSSVSKFVVTDFGSGSATTTMPNPNNVDKGVGGTYEVLGPNMTEEQTRAAINREIERARAAAGVGSGSGSAGSGRAGSGSADVGSAGTRAP